MQSSDLLINFLINLVAGIVGILVVLWLERQRRPSLSMKVGEPGGIGEGDPLGRPQTKWPHIQIHNRNVPRWLSWVYRGEPALACRAWITFHHFDGHRIFDREMNVRWSETPEPTTEVINTTDKGQVVRLVGMQDTTDIQPGEYVNVDVVVKFKDESDCFGWNNESYLHGWRHPAWKLEKGRYIAKIRVKSGGKEYTDAFLIANDVPFEDFRLEPIDDDLKRRLK